MTERKQPAPKRPRVASSGKQKPGASGPARLAGASRAALRERATGVHQRLSRALPAPACELDFGNAWQLLVATILSAQSTDRMVNRVTPALFARFPSPAALATAQQEEVEQLVRQTGFFRNKARAIREASRLLVERFGGQVPRTLEELTQLPGVARKTANVVLGTAYRISSGITVDTHAGRVARRLGLTREEDPVGVEKALCELFPEDAWIDTGHRLVLHGRYVCLARKPRCERCPLAELCPSAEAKPVGPWEERAVSEGRLVAARGEERPAE